MQTFCLVLSGRPVDGRPVPESESALAAAFGMDRDGFRERVWQRAPLIVRQGLDEGEAAAQSNHLRSLGAQVQVLPENHPLLWLLRDGRVLGPLPDGALAQFAQAGDRWSVDGSEDWRDVPAAAGTSPPPLPIARALRTSDTSSRSSAPSTPTTPPPLAGGPAGARRRPLLWLGAAAIVLLVGAVWLFQSAAPEPDPTQAHVYTPRPLQPLAPSPHSASATHCDGPAVAPANDEDRFLITGGERQLSGVSQRSGDTYVAEAILGFDAQCRPDAVQLYAFRSGVLIGPLLYSPMDPRSSRLDNLQLSEDGTAHFTLAQCAPSTGDCAAPVQYSAHVNGVNDGVSFTTEHPGSGIEIISRPPPSYPASAIRQRHEGTVMLRITVDGSGTAQDIVLEKSSGYAELDQAALEAVRHWRFKTTPAAGGEPPPVQARLPVRFDLNQPKP